MQLDGLALTHTTTGLTGEWWRCFIDNSEEAMLVCNADGNILKLNSQAANLLQIRLKEPADYNLSDALTPSLSQKVNAFLKVDGQRQIT